MIGDTGHGAYGNSVTYLCNYSVNLKLFYKVKFIFKSTKLEGRFKSPNQDMLVNCRSFSHYKL